MIAALLGLLAPVAGVFYVLGLFHGARDAHDSEADTPVSFAAESLVSVQSEQAAA